MEESYNTNINDYDDAYANSKLPARTTNPSSSPSQQESEVLAFAPSSSSHHHRHDSSQYLSLNGGIYHGNREPVSKGEPDTTEAGLELLFAASLIQQKDESDKQQQQQQLQLEAHPPTPGAKAISSCSENESMAGDSPMHTSVAEMAESSTTTGEVVEPNERDVLCGRGGFINKHVGNIVYRKVVDYNKAIYKQVPKRHRILVSQSIVQTIEKHGGRFLQPVSGQGRKNQEWTCIQFRRAVQKTSQALREPISDTPDASATASTCEPMACETTCKSVKN